MFINISCKKMCPIFVLTFFAVRWFVPNSVASSCPLRVGSVFCGVVVGWLVCQISVEVATFKGLVVEGGSFVNRLFFTGEFIYAFVYSLW